MNSTGKTLALTKIQERERGGGVDKYYYESIWYTRNLK